MGKPRMIILIRHGQSEGNKNRDIHQSVPDHRVKLTPEGWKQAVEAGHKLRSLLLPSDTLHFFTSPYRRTRETTSGILASLTSDTPSPSPFPRHKIKVYEEPRLREQDFGNFQPCSAEMERMWRERADYGHFFYRIPNGESAADAYDRVSGFNESLWRGFGEEDCASVSVLVTHGLMTRVFLMKWYHFSVEYFEDLRNVNHCEFVVMKKNADSGKYDLQNQLRTWSELRREKAAAAAASASSTNAVDPASPIPIRRGWGGCPDDCNHAKHAATTRPPRRQNTADLFMDELREDTAKAQLEDAIKRKTSRPHSGQQDDDEEEEEGEDDPRGRTGSPAAFGTDNHADPNATNTSTPSSTTTKPASSNRPGILSPDHLAILEIGRDGGGSKSGAASRSGSTDSESRDRGDRERITGEDEAADGSAGSHRRAKTGSMAMALNGAFDGGGVERMGGMRIGARADALGDQSGNEDEDLERREAEDRSLRGSVY